MDTPKSTVREPLRFFQWILNPINFELYRGYFFDGFELEPDAIIERERDTVIYTAIFPDGYDNPIEAKITENFTEIIKGLFYRELMIFNQNFETALSEISFNNNLPINFLSHLNQILTEIEQTSRLIIEWYPFIDNTLKQLRKYIEDKQSLFSGKNEILSEPDAVSTQETASNEEERIDRYSVKKIFGYFKDRMKPEQEYDRLIDHISQFVETGNLTDEQQFQRFRHIHNIQNEEIRFTFHVLWSENKKIINRRRLCSLIKLSFDDFCNVEENYLYSKLSTKPPLDKTYIPEFIRTYKKN